MNEGFWINARTGQSFKVPEHCVFAKSPEGADAMGLPAAIRAKIQNLSCGNGSGPEREQVLLEVMSAGYIRFRGHGSQYTFEFYGDTAKNLWACYQFAADYAGPFTYIVINNLKTKEQFAAHFQEFQERMKEDESSVLRIARKLLETEHRIPEGWR